MPECSHQKMTLLLPKAGRLRCRKCHLIISVDELKGGFCPECHAATGERRYDFEEVVAEKEDRTKYRCDECGEVIEC